MGNVVDLAAARSRRVIRRALIQAQDALWANLSPTHNLSDAKTIERIRRIVLSDEVQRALHCNDEPVCVAYLDTIRAIIFQPARPPVLREALWSVLDQPILNKVLGKRHNSRMTISYEPRWLDEREWSEWSLPPESA
jgi:hypothetical protein